MKFPICALSSRIAVKSLLLFTSCNQEREARPHPPILLFTTLEFGREGTTHFDLMVMGLPGIFEALKVNAVLGSSRPSPLNFGSWGFTASGPATMPRPVSTSAWPREPALEPRSGISLRAWKFRGLRPLTTIGAVVDSARATLDPFANDPITLRCSTKCCCSSFRLPLLAVALLSSQISSCLT